MEKGSNNQLRRKGRFIKKKQLEKQLKFAEMRSKLKKSDATLDVTSKISKYQCSGRRIVELGELAKNLKCCKCGHVLSLENIVDEKRLGLNSVLTVLCEPCSSTTLVSTGKSHHSSGFKREISDVNTKVVFGTIHAGIGCDGLNKILACLNIPVISKNLYRRYQSEVGPAIEKAAKESCKRAAKEERQLVIENIEQLCENLSPNIVKEIYPHFHTLRSATSTNPTSNMVDPSTFDATLGEIINIIVSYDMGWSKRGNGRSYDSLNGYGAIIGMLSGKVLDYATRNRKCKKCDMGQLIDSHDCHKNFTGSAKAMEASVGAELINNSPIVEAAQLKVRVVIGDEDSSTIAAVRKENSQEIFKLADVNHLGKNFTKELYKIQAMFPEMKRPATIAHLKKCFKYAVCQNKGNESMLAKAVYNIPNHVFGKHDECGSWCHEDKTHKILLKDSTLYTKLMEIFTKYANNAAKFAVAASSQANEALNNTMAHKCPKNICYSLSRSADDRMASAVCTTNDGDGYVLDVEKLMNVSPGKNNEVYSARRDKIRFVRAAKAKLPSSKVRRNVLKQDREALRKKTERKEGVTYQSNCGLEIDANSNYIIESQNDLEPAQNIPITPDTATAVYFDLETSGLGYSSDILQIAATSEGRTFSLYVTPTQAIHEEAGRVTGLKNIAGELYHNGRKVDSIPIEDALQAFLQYLNLSSKPCLLIAHNATFDSSHLLLAAHKYGMTLEFRKIIAGFSDTYSILKKIYPDRKGAGMFKLERLATDLLNVDATGQFHEALYDVKILERISSQFIPREVLFQDGKHFMERSTHCLNLRTAASIIPTLSPLTGTLSKGMIKKIAEAGITFEKLKELKKERGIEGLLHYLSEKKAMVNHV